MRNSSKRQFKAVVIGVSTGGVSALKSLLGALPADFPIPILVVAHISPDSDDGLAVLLDAHCSIRVKEADEQDALEAGTVYLAPANYHLLLDSGDTLALSVDPTVNFARPSVDVLFQSAAERYGSAVIGVILTGAGADGSQGLLSIKERGGLAVVQDPADAEVDSMPGSALQLLKADHVLRLDEMADLLLRLARGER